MVNNQIKKGDQIRNFIAQSSVIKNNIGGIPFSKEVDREIKNYQEFLHNPILKRQRTRLGFYEELDNGKIVGYRSLTILSSANPTKYEREYIGLKGELFYIQGKLIVVHPDYWGTGVAKRLLEKTLEIMNDLTMDFVADIKQENQRALNFLKKYRIEKSFEWQTPSGTKMWRVSKCQS